MPKNTDIKVEYLTRVEGHGNIVVNIKDGKVEKCDFHVVESPRFFEGMVRGRSIFEAQHITSRICGICSCGHTLASIQGGEDALGFKPSRQTQQLRKVMMHLETLDSHLLHIYLLVAPDLLGVKSFVPLISSHNAVVRRALRMKKHVNDICDILLGRHTHPITPIIGGFTKLPNPKELDKMTELLKGMRADMDETVKLGAGLKFPQFERDTEFVALVNNGSDEYPFIEGDIGSTDIKKPVSRKDYRKVTNEFVDPRSSAKFARFNRDSYMVGALARFNLNADKLRPEAKKIAEAIGLRPVCKNPYLNTAAQLVECVHCLEDAIAILENLKSKGVDYKEQVTIGVNEKGIIPVKAGDGVGVVEVPRGILFHNYKIDAKGIIEQADCIIPTGQNINNIEYDFRKLVTEIMDKSKEEITLALEMLVRAYDPCISCSAHFLDVKFD